MVEPEGKKRNFSMICVAFFCMFVSFSAVTNLQWSINADGNVGLYSLAMVTSVIVFFSLFLSTLLMYILGYKWNIVGGQVAVLGYMAANMYPKAVLMYSGSCSTWIWMRMIVCSEFGE